MIGIPVSRLEHAPGSLPLALGLLASLPAAVAYLAGPDLVFEFANDDYLLLVGGRDIIGRPVREALPEVAGQGYFEMLDRVMATGEAAQAYEAEAWVRQHGEHAERIFLDYVFQPVRDAHGKVAGVLAHATDVTSHVEDRRRLQALTGQLAAAQERYQTLFETMPQGVVYHTADGSVITANPAAKRIYGADRDEMAQRRNVDPTLRAVHEDGSPVRPEDMPVAVALRTGQVVPDQVLGVPHARTGERRWLRVTAIPDAWDATGRPQRAYAMFTDLTDQRRMEATLRESASLLGRLRDANVLGVVLADEERIYDANDAFLDMIGYSRLDLQAGRIDWRAMTPPEWTGSDDEALEQLRTTGASRPFEKQLVHRDGHHVPLLIGAALIDRDPLRWVTFVVDLTARQQAEEERVMLLARERAARADADSAGERLGFLLRAGALVTATRDRQELVDQAAQLVVPILADVCAVFLPTANGDVKVAALAHRGPDGAVALADLEDHPIPAGGPLTLRTYYRRDINRLVQDVSAQLPHWEGRAPALSEIAARYRAESMLAAQVKAGQRPLGVVVLGRTSGRPRFTDADIRVVEELARRLAVGLANVDISAREHAFSETLQRALLPDSLPAVPGLDLATRYLPATMGADVGGDWYDAFPVDGDRIGLVIGDVTGHNITSAAMMGPIRSILRAYTMDNPDPADALARTNSVMTRTLPDALATAVVVVLDPATGELAYAIAGHPPPLLATRRGAADYLDDCVGTILGASSGSRFTTCRRRLPPGARLVLYTDGLIEDRQRDITEGLDTLATTLRACAPRTAEQTCALIQETLLGATARADDVCLLAIRLTQGRRRS